ncbi:MAG: hypothetical protein JNN07_19680 [Verrucomicrobiales bacterium]|nr:hypothetical protein [Verrucomicrobiales bacterium]
MSVLPLSLLRPRSALDHARSAAAGLLERRSSPPTLIAGVSTLALGLMCSLAASAAEPAAAAPASRVLQVTQLQRTTPVDFEKEILPLLRNNCLACHNRTKAKADLVLETPADILKGGESGPAVIPKKGAESLLLKVSAHQEKPFMPPKDNKVEAVDFEPEQLGLIKLWIDQGATGEVRAGQTVQWEPLPAGINPILAVALTADGQLAACGRANQLAIYHVPTQRFIDRLTDPALVKSGLYSKPGIAHRDMVNALAFNADGSLLASGDYRLVKLWERSRTEDQLDFKADGLAAPTSIDAMDQARRLATGHADGRVVLWTAESGMVRTQWQAHGHSIRTLRFSPDGKQLATASGSQRVGVWNATNGASMQWLNTPSLVYSVAWTRDGKRLVSGHADSQLRVWKLPEAGETNATLVKEWKAHEGAVLALAMHPENGQRLVSGGGEGSVRVWDLDKGELVKKMDQGGAVTSVAFRPDGKRIASTGSNSVARVWNEEDGKMVVEIKGDREASAAVDKLERNVSFAQGEVAYRRGALEEAKKREKAEADFAAKALENRVNAEKALTEKQKAVLAAVEARAAAEKAPAELAIELQKSNEARDAVETAAKQAEAEAAAAQQRVEQAKATADAAGKAAKELAEAVKADAGKTPSLAAAQSTAEKLAAAATGFLEDARKVAERFAKDAEPKRKAANEAKGPADKKAAEIAEKLKQAPEKLAASVKALEAVEKETETLLAAKRSSEDQWLANQRAAKKAADAVPEAAGALQAAETAAKKVDADLQAARKWASDAVQPLLSAAFSPDGAMLATAGILNKVQTWGAETGAGIDSYAGALGGPAGIVFGSPGSLVMVSSNALPVKVSRSDSWSLVRVLGTDETHSPMLGRVNALQFSPDGKSLATGSGEPSRSGELLLWEVASGKLLRNFTNAHSDVVLSIDFSEDGKLLASSASDRFVKVWNLESGKMARSFEGHTHHVLGVSWKRDARTLASAGADKVIKLWNYVTGEQKRTIGGAEKEVTSIGYVDSTGEALVTSGDSQVRLVSEDGKTVRSFGGAKDFVQAAAVTPDGRWVVGGGQDSILRIWDGRSGQLLKAFDP